MEPTQGLNQIATDFYRLAFLITGDVDASIDLAAEALASQNDSGLPFSDPAPRGARTALIAQALASIRMDLAASALRLAWKPWQEPSFIPRELDGDITPASLEQALRAIDVFPRCVLLLCVFEGLSQTEAAALLDAEPGLVAKAQAVGLGELTRNILQTQNWLARQAVPYADIRECAHA
jgi:DNA-directed RNA polymerase specialized sigma24 family protein